MPIIRFDPPPIQDDFGEDDVRSMDVGRRQLRTEWPRTLYKPDSPDKDWCLILPFPNTYQNAFFSMCDVDAHAHHASTGKLCLFLRGSGRDEEPPTEATKWVDTVGKYVAMKDFLALSFALDYERKQGDPNRSQIKIGTLRARAKPYGSQAATKQTTAAADQLVEHCLVFLEVMSCYESADCVVSMPPSDPAKSYSLPRYLAARIAEKWKREDLTENVRTVTSRTSIKGVRLAKKLDTLLGSIKVTKNTFDGKRVLLIDDLYQSGISMNYCALLLLKAGARKVFGLACEKTCRNDDNVSGRI
ncbi:MAG: phosphoribosyltransferase [Bryobacterales bacterium]|nr:phosphoribosyltransferase [Bryobacterales bacterium]